MTRSGVQSVVREGHVGNADIAVTADTKTWLGFLAKEQNLVLGLTAEKNPNERIATAIAGVWQMLPFVMSSEAITLKFCLNCFLAKPNSRPTSRRINKKSGFINGITNAESSYY